MTPELPVFAEGHSLAPGYEVIRHFNRARTLDVYEVWSEERDCHCMAKTLRPDRLDDGAAGKRLLREGRLLTRLAHPHLVRAYETFREPQPVVVLETLGGATLSWEIRRRARRLPLPDVVELGLQLSSALGYLHRRNILHLDVKPSNVVVDGGRAKLLDLSLVRAPGRGIKGRGTRLYLSPEQARGDDFTPACDVWGLGALLHRSLVGGGPFHGEEPRYPQLEMRAPSIRRLRRVPAAVAEVVDACLEPDPAERPSLHELSDVLDEAA
jgi:serine/threonine protein kinase